METTGTIKRIMNTEQVTDKFSKREFVIETQDKYPQLICFQLTQTRTDLIDPYQVGEGVNVHFNLRGREWTSPKGEVKYFNTLEAWQIQKL